MCTLSSLSDPIDRLPKYELFKDGDTVDTQNDSTLITSLFVVMGAAVLTASIAVFPVYERRNNSKHLQMVSGRALQSFLLSSI
jgi:hypothetical protein